MSDLTPLKVKNSFKSLLHVTDTSAGLTASLQYLKDGDGTPSTVQLSTDACVIDALTVTNLTVSSVTTPITLSQGGTGAASAANARANLGLILDSDVESYATAFTAGESISDRDMVYQHTDGKVYVAKANSTASAATVIGFAQASASVNDSVKIRVGGVQTGLSGLSAGVMYYLSTTAGQLTATPPSGSGQHLVAIGIGRSSSSLVFHPQFIATRN